MVQLLSLSLSLSVSLCLSLPGAWRRHDAQTVRDAATNPDDETAPSGFLNLAFQGLDEPPPPVTADLVGVRRWREVGELNRCLGRASMPVKGRC